MPVTVITAAVAAASGCGGEATGDGATIGERPRSDRLVDFSQEPPYVNTFDVDPGSGDFLLTTNRGFWRIDPRTNEVTRLRGTITAGRRTSTVGTFLELAVTGPGRLLGSGHPDSEDDGLPPFLGLIESADGGETWRPTARLGDADLHKIVLKHDRMYAFDAVLGALLISTDGGRTFEERFTPRQLVIDFDVDPRDPDRIFASTEQELLRSEDGGQAWRAVDRAEGIRLVWPAPDAFYRAERDGAVLRSRDGGASWEAVGRVPGEPYEIRAEGPQALLLALSDGTVVETRDGGRTWTEAFSP